LFLFGRPFRRQREQRFKLLLRKLLIHIVERSRNLAVPCRSCRPLSMA
jgi:hypothetical protein